MLVGIGLNSGAICEAPEKWSDIQNMQIKNRFIMMGIYVYVVYLFKTKILKRPIF